MTSGEPLFVRIFYGGSKDAVYSLRQVEHSPTPDLHGYKVRRIDNNGVDYFFIPKVLTENKDPGYLEPGFLFYE